MHHPSPSRLLLVASFVCGIGTSVAALTAPAAPATGNPTAPSTEPPTAATAVDNPLLALATLTYQPKDLVTGNLRIAGAAPLQQAAAFWCEGLELVHPDLAWGLETGTTEAGWEKLLAGTVDVALFDRPLTAAEEQAWDTAEKQRATPRRLAAIAVGFRHDVPAAGAGPAAPPNGPATRESAADAAIDDDVPGDVRPDDQHPLYIVVAVPEDGAWPRVLEEFVSYVLSFSGQVDVAKDGLLPLSRAEIHAQQEALGWTIER
jgi:ABC-type phosphate transport system substrate-binding protein